MQHYEFHPLCTEYDLWPQETMDEAVADMKRFGFDKAKPITTYDGKIVFGRNRYLAAMKAEVEPVYRELKLRKGETLEDAVSRDNDLRRHDPVEQQKRRRADRVKRMTTAREEGQSLRTIAENEGVSETQARRDLAKGSGAPGGGAPAPTGGKVTGKDGKKQTAKKALTLCERCERLKPGVGLPDCPNCAALRAKKKPKVKRKKPQPPAVVKDKTGEKVPDRLRDAFADPSLSDLVGELESVEAMFAPKSVVERAGKLTAHYPFILIAKVDECLHESLHQLQVALQSLKAGLPHAVCPKCKAEENCKPCKTCRGCGHVPEHRYKELSAEKA